MTWLTFYCWCDSVCWLTCQSSSAGWKRHPCRPPSPPKELLNLPDCVWQHAYFCQCVCVCVLGIHHTVLFGSEIISLILHSALQCQVSSTTTSFKQLVHTHTSFFFLLPFLFPAFRLSPFLPAPIPSLLLLYLTVRQTLSEVAYCSVHKAGRGSVCVCVFICMIAYLFWG